ncbi:DUF2971 domain-containing protein [Vibrio diabolicus]|uniref:DUF2971 domain-containing protein n=1 Tax=Vibrio diabolicus TaxID=50719 RepID=UPI00215E5286|nr:DUF2971 domain-containing protein [Vibrio diabolicus]MCS0436333.1 DUF2971 domain-containing protein [Vibrio diabolicus]
MNIEENRRLLEQRLDRGNFPEVLYKYRTVDQLKMILDNFSFWFASPDTFNDPFDCSLSEVESYDLEDAQSHFRLLGITESNIEQALVMFQSHPEKLNALVAKAKNEAITQKGVLALSSTNDDILLWSHYADYHKGVAVGLELRKDLDFFLMPIKINYEESYEPLNYLKNPQQAIIDTLKIKSAQWEYEKEVRVYKSASGLYQISPDAIKEIRFGIKTSEQDIQDIKKLCLQKGLTEIAFYKAKKECSKFAINFDKLPNKQFKSDS